MEEKSVVRHNTGAKISGRVFSYNGMTLNGAKLTSDEIETTTLADGSYTFNDLLPGTYKINIRLQGFQSVDRTIYVPEDGESIQDFYLAEAIGNAKIYGYVVDNETGKPVNEGAVILILPVTNKYSHIEMDGYYEFTNLPAGTFTLSTSVPGYEDMVTIIMLEESEAKTYEFLCKIIDIEEPPWG